MAYVEFSAISKHFGDSVAVAELDLEIEQENVEEVYVDGDQVSLTVTSYDASGDQILERQRLLTEHAAPASFPPN